MSYYYMIHGHPEVKKHTKHGRTKQSYKDQCDINKLLERAQKAGGISHLERHGAHYGDYAAIDWEDLPLQLAKGREIFGELPAEIKREFNQSPGEFFAYVTDPVNAERLPELLPKIAERGNFFPRVNTIETRDSSLQADSPPVESQPQEPQRAPDTPTE